MSADVAKSPWREGLETWFIWIDRGLDRSERAVLILAVLTMATVSVVNVALRNLTGSSLLFANDITQALLVIMTFMGLGLGARRARHIRVSAVHDLLPPAARKGLLIMTSFLTAGLLFALAGWALDYARSTQRSCRILPEAIELGGLSIPLGAMPQTLGLLLVLLTMTLVGHAISNMPGAGRQIRNRFSAWSAWLIFIFGVIGLVLAVWGLWELVADLIANRSGRCRIMPSTGLPVYLVHLVVPLGLTLGAVQFSLAGVRNLISRDNYLSWHQRDEYLDAEDGESDG